MDKIQEEFSDYKESGFELVLTADDSFSLRQKTLNEDMHSSAGALKETDYIYYKPLLEFLEKHSNKSTQVISVGLGLGYNEVLAASVILKLGLDIKIVSYEKEKDLVKLFKKRIQQPSSFPEYFKIFKNYNLKVKEVCDYLLKNCCFEPSLNEESLTRMRPSSKAILFDAYSNKTSNDLWSESFLKKLLGEKAFAPSMLTTYASTGTLNRALKEEGFKKTSKRSGFGFKRESTLAFML